MKKFFKFATVAVAAILMASCGNKAADNAAGQDAEAQTEQKGYTVKYHINAMSGKNYASFDTPNGDQEVAIEVAFDADKATFTIPVKLIKTDKPLEKEDLKM